MERELGLAPGGLAPIEQGREPLETEHLDAPAALYGLDAGDVAEGKDTTPRLRQVQVLFKNWRSEIPERVRSEIARAAAARRAVKQLERELGKLDRYEALRAQFRHEGTYGPPESGWTEGRELAERLRTHLGIAADAPVPSMGDLVGKLGIELVPVALSASQVAAFSLADQDHGPAIVINLRGANSNPWVRRFVIAHELCHVLHDELTHEAIQEVQYYAEQVGGLAEAGPEPRANAFAAHLLAPDDAVRSRLASIRDSVPSLEGQLWNLMVHFGINFKTARYRLKHLGWAAERELAGVSRVSTRPPAGIDRWHEPEALRDFDYFPCPSVPAERRGLLASLVAEAWAKELLDRRQALELLEAAPDEPLELLTGELEV